MSSSNCLLSNKLIKLLGITWLKPSIKAFSCCSMSFSPKVLVDIKVKERTLAILAYTKLLTYSSLFCSVTGMSLPPGIRSFSTSLPNSSS